MFSTSAPPGRRNWAKPVGVGEVAHRQADVVAVSSRSSMVPSSPIPKYRPCGGSGERRRRSPPGTAAAARQCRTPRGAAARRVIALEGGVDGVGPVPGPGRSGSAPRTWAGHRPMARSLRSASRAWPTPTLSAPSTTAGPSRRRHRRSGCFRRAACAGRGPGARTGSVPDGRRSSHLTGCSRRRWRRATRRGRARCQHGAQAWRCQAASASPTAAGRRRGAAASCRRRGRARWQPPRRATVEVLAGEVAYQCWPASRARRPAAAFGVDSQAARPAGLRAEPEQVTAEWASARARARPRLKAAA